MPFAISVENEKKCILNFEIAYLELNLNQN